LPNVYNTRVSLARLADRRLAERSPFAPAQANGVDPIRTSHLQTARVAGVQQRHADLQPVPAASRATRWLCSSTTAPSQIVSHLKRKMQQREQRLPRRRRWTLAFSGRRDSK